MTMNQVANVGMALRDTLFSNAPSDMTVEDAVGVLHALIAVLINNPKVPTEERKVLVSRLFLSYASQLESLRSTAASGEPVLAPASKFTH